MINPTMMLELAEVHETGVDERERHVFNDVDLEAFVVAAVKAHSLRLFVNLHKTAIESGARFAPAYEIDGGIELATYTVTLTQLQTIVSTAARNLAEQGKQPCPRNVPT